MLIVPFSANATVRLASTNKVATTRARILLYTLLIFVHLWSIFLFHKSTPYRYNSNTISADFEGEIWDCKAILTNMVWERRTES